MASPETILALDSGALIQSTKNQKFDAVIRKWLSAGAQIVIPAPCLSEALRGSPKDAPINRIIAAVGTILPLSAATARHAGELLGRYRSRDTVDAMIVAIALAYGTTDMLTTDPRDMVRLSADAFNVIVV